MFTNLKRILKFGWQGFSRNKGLSLQVIFIMCFAIFTLTSLLIFREANSYMLDQAKKKVDVAIYFKKQTEEGKILTIQKELRNFSKEIEAVDYVSREQARQEFVQQHQNDPLYLTALEEVGDNPFLASLRVKAENPVFYARISEFLNSGPFANLIEKISYFENKTVIDRLFALSSNLKKAGWIISLILGILVFLICFNTVKLTIFSLREEIGTMRLVGASNWFTRGPFLVQGILYGLISLVIVDIIFFILFAFFSPDLVSWLLGFNLFDYFQNNFLVLLLWQIVFAAVLGGFSSYLSVRRYLKI